MRVEPVERDVIVRGTDNGVHFASNCVRPVLVRIRRAPPRLTELPEKERHRRKPGETIVIEPARVLRVGAPDPGLLAEFRLEPKGKPNDTQTRELPVGVVLRMEVWQLVANVGTVLTFRAIPVGAAAEEYAVDDSDSLVKSGEVREDGYTELFKYAA